MTGGILKKYELCCLPAIRPEPLPAARPKGNHKCFARKELHSRLRFSGIDHEGHYNQTHQGRGIKQIQIGDIDKAVKDNEAELERREGDVGEGAAGCAGVRAL